MSRVLASAAASLIVLLSLCVVPARAQTTTTADATADATAAWPRRPYRPVPRQRIGVRAFGLFEVNVMTATDTFDAVLGTSRLNGVGGGAELTGIWKGFFLRVDASSVKKTGTRVLVVDDAVFPLDIPLTIEMMPVEFGAGWRSSLGRRRRADAHVGAGYVHLIYRETSSFAAVGDNTDTTFDGLVAFGGVDARVGRFLTIGGEAQYRSIPDAIGTAGASKAFSESDLGGLSARVKIGVAF